jgi:hypothetical protein
VLSICCSTAFARPARARAKIELQTCEDLLYASHHGLRPIDYPTVGDELRLLVGSLTVCVIACGKFEVKAHRGTLNEYFAKRLLTVK